MFKLKQLEYFRAVMLCGSINKASDYLCVSQPVVSKTIAQLERSIELQLFERKSSTLIPTKNAYVLNRYCEDIFDKTNKLSSMLQQLKMEHIGILKLCASPALCNFLIPKIISQFNQNINIKFESALLSDIPKLVEGGFFDLALSIWPIYSEKLNCNYICQSEFVFVCHSQNHLSKMKRINFSHLLDQEFIFTNRSMPIGAYIENQLSEYGISFQRYIEVDRSDIACSIINFGRGVSILNKHAVDLSMWKNLVVIELDPPIPSSIYLITPKHGGHSALTAQFIDFLKPSYIASLAAI